MIHRSEAKEQEGDFDKNSSFELTLTKLLKPDLCLLL